MKRFSIFSTISMTTMMITMLGAVGLFYAGQANAWAHSVRVATTDGLIAAMLEAERTHESTEISVAPGHYLFTQVFNSTYGGNALPNVTTEILIVGEDPTTTIFDLGGRDSFVPRFFTVLPTGNLELRNLTLTGAGSYGSCQGQPQNCEDMGGGAVLNIRGALTIKSCILWGNQTYSAYDGAEFDQLDGGAIESVGGILTIDDSTIEGNSAEGFGGGIALHGGSANISHSIISGNSLNPGAIYDATFFGLIGGGIFVASGEMTIDSSTISGNAAGVAGALEQEWSVWGVGGGIYNAGSLLLTNSAVINNSVVDFGGGAGIYNAGGMKIENSTIAQNVAGGVGGGIFNSHDLLLQGTTLSDNNAFGNVATEYFGPNPVPSYPPGCSYPQSNCDIGGNGLHSDPGANTQVATSVLANNNGSDCSGVVVSDGRNALGTNSGCAWTKSPSLQGHSTYDQINIDPLLGTFSDDGVAGDAHYPLLPGSPAIDAGGAVGTYCTLLDQLGHRRVAASGNPNAWSICDLGAIEYQR
jgi:hypothetical protein